MTYPSYRGNLLKTSHITSSMELFYEGARFIKQAMDDFPHAKRMIVHGASLGTAMIAGMIHYLADEEKKKLTHVIYEAPFSSGNALFIKNMPLTLPWLMWGPIYEDTIGYIETFAKFRNESKPEDIWIRVIGKENDELVGFEEAELIAEKVDAALPGSHPKDTVNQTLITHKGVAHAKMLCRAFEGREDYKIYAQFLMYKAHHPSGISWTGR